MHYHQSEFQWEKIPHLKSIETITAVLCMVTKVDFRCRDWWFEFKIFVKFNTVYKSENGQSL
jgi:hypothetical protein